MAHSIHISRVNSYDAMLLEAALAVIAHSKDVLKNSRAADTFAGRKTQEPFPKEKGQSAYLRLMLAG